MNNNIQTIQNKIYEIRGQRVMLDRDLAELYHVTTGNLNKAVKRNIRRFPPDFMFQLTKGEFEKLKNDLIFQNGISSWGISFTTRTISTKAPVCNWMQLVQLSQNCNPRSLTRSIDAELGLYKIIRNNTKYDE